MNYRHAFHAGNFADVLKHAVLVYALGRLCLKDKPFRVIDTHAGVGRYDLTGSEAQRSPEWRDGIGRILDGGALPPEAAALLEAYVAAVRALNRDAASADALLAYPGSPLLIAASLRAGDAALFAERHPVDAAALDALFAGDRRVRVACADGYGLLKASVPPPERRGLVLIDPPYEARDEFVALARAAVAGLRRWPTGVFIFWRPLKDLWSADRFDEGLAAWLIEERNVAPEKILRADLWVRALGQEGPLAGAGVTVVNPPFGLAEAVRAAAPTLASLLRQGEGAGWRVQTAAEFLDLGADPEEAAAFGQEDGDEGADR